MACKSLLGACLALALACTSAAAQGRLNPAYKLDRSGTSIIALSRLSTATGCQAATGIGRVTERHLEQGVLKGVSFKTDKYGDSYINLFNPNEIADPDLRRRVGVALDGLLTVGNRLKVTTLGCGAAGRIEKLASVELIGAPASVATPAAAAESAAQSPEPSGPAKPTKWKVRQVSKVQRNIEISSDDRRFNFSISCMRDGKGAIIFNSFLVGPRRWSIATEGQSIAIDGVVQAWEIDGADEGVVLSDDVTNNTVSLSEKARSLLSKGQRFNVAGRMERGPLRAAQFDISAGEAAFAIFESGCMALPRS